MSFCGYAGCIPYQNSPCPQDYPQELVYAGQRLYFCTPIDKCSLDMYKKKPRTSLYETDSYKSLKVYPYTNFPLDVPPCKVGCPRVYQSYFGNV